MFYYNISGIKICIICENDYLINRLKPFLIEPVDDTDMEITIQKLVDFKNPEGTLIVDEKVRWLRKLNPEEGYIIYTNRDNDEKGVIMQLDTDINWRKIILSVDETGSIVHERGGNTNRWSNLYSFIFCGIAFRNMIIRHDGIVIHSSSIAFRGMGIIFTAPSGTGKSTHVRQWEEKYGKDVIVVNDDTPAIRFIKDVPMLSGTPWSGSSDKFANIQVPLKAIVVIEQHKENIIRRLDTLEALTFLMPRCFLPYYDEGSMILTYGLIERLLDKVQIYHLKCLPNNEAAEIVYQCIM